MNFLSYPVSSSLFSRYLFICREITVDEAERSDILPLFDLVGITDSLTAIIKIIIE